jgi:threonine dehydrogenase-like Zn-dependent dehydrogenase
MKIACLVAPQQFELRQVPEPEIRPDEVLLRVAACGVCTSELDLWEGKAGGEVYPHYSGHEVSGVVVQVGKEVSGLQSGDPVGAWVNGRGFAEYVAVRGSYCYPCPGLSLEIAALAEPLSCAVNSVEMAQLSLGEDVVIIGVGFMGALVQLLVCLRGPRQLIVADVRAEALSRASQMGATRTVDLTQESLPEVVKALTDGRGADVSFEVAGRQAALQMLGEVTRMSGKVVVVGYHQGGMREINLAYWNWMAFNILNAHFRELATIQRGMRIGMRLLTSRRLDLSGLVTHRFPLDEVGRAFQTAYDKPTGFVKAVVTM